VTIGELRRVLDNIGHLCASAGANAAAKDIKLLSEALAPHVQSDVVACLSAIQRQLTEAKPKARGKGVRTPRTTALNGDTIELHVMALRAAGTDRDMFDTAFETLRGDKSIKSADVAEVARRYVDSVTKYKSIKAALEDISKAFVRQARFENKLR